MTTEDCAGGNLTDVVNVVRNTHRSAVESVKYFLGRYTKSLYNLTPGDKELLLVPFQVRIDA